MLPLSPLLLLICPAVICVAAHGAGDLQGFSLPTGNTAFDPTDPCMVVAPPCLSEADRYSLEALRSIHHMMDDDQDGGIEVEESMEFIIEDMKLQQTNKHSNLHREDQHITVEELWRGWKSSEVHNWTQDDVLRWLRDFVELPQYERNFKEFRVNGNTLPRIAANEPSFLSTQLRVQDQRDKHKLNIKALDVVLFGPPTRPPHNYMKDLLLIVSVVMGVGGCWFAQAQNKASKVHVSKMMKDLESLQRAEQSLTELQEQLERAQEEKRNVAEEKENLEVKMRDEIMGAQEEAYRLHELRQGAVTELSRLRYAEEELEQVLGALKQAEKDMQASWTASEALQQWLQLTYEVEVQYYNVKKHSAELQLASAKEEAERIKKKRSSLLGTLHVAHSSSLDQVDKKILEAKNALSEVTACLRERLHRWQHIERLCGFPIMRNSGLATLTAQLYSDSFALGLPRVLQPPCSCHSSLHGSIEDLLEESPILSQMTVPVAPLKRSPRTQGSTICRARRPGVATQPPTAMISQDPDLLIPIRAPYPCFDEEDNFLLKTLKKQDSLETHSDTDHTPSPSLGKIYRSPTVDTSSQKLYHDDTELLADPSVTKPSNREAEVAPVRTFSTGDLELDVASRKTAKDKLLHTSSESLKVPKEESLIEPAPRKISREIIGTSFDMGSRKISRDDAEHLFDSLPRRVPKDSMGISLDAGFRKLARIKGDCPLDSSARSLAKDKTVETSRTQQRISRDESSADSASLKMLPREKFDALMDPPPYAEKQEFGLESANRRILIDEHEMSAGSLRQRIPRLTRDESNVSTDSLAGKLTERVDVGSSEFTSPSNRFAQPDLMVTSQGPMTSSDLFNVGLVYDGILEKSCSSSQSRQMTDVEPPVPPPRAATQSHTSPSETGEEKSKDKEKSKKSLKLKSLFKKKNESATEKPQSGLHKL